MDIRKLIEAREQFENAVGEGEKALNFDEINRLVALHRAGGDVDFDTLHRMEDKLHQDVLRSIADGTCEDPAGCARAALRTLEADVVRWYA